MRFWRFLSSVMLTLLTLVMFNHTLYQAAAQVSEATHPPEADETSMALTLVWQNEVTREGMILAPSDLVVDDWGNVYVSMNGTRAEGHIKKFDSEGQFVTQWGYTGSKDGQIDLAAGITVDAEGNVYIADFNNIRIQKFDSSGNFLLEWPTAPPRGPASVAVDAQGYVYVDNFFSHQHYVQKFDESGNLVHEWGTSGSGDGEFETRPEDIALDQDHDVYIADRLNHRIQKFDADGEFLAAFGGESSSEGNGRFHEPIGVALDSEGNIYVMDSYFLQKLTPDGTCIAQWAIAEGGNLDRATGIVDVDGEGHIYVFAYGTSPEGLTPLVVKKFRQPDNLTDDSWC